MMKEKLLSIMLLVAMLATSFTSAMSVQAATKTGKTEAKSVVVETQKELNKALKSGAADTVTISTDLSKKFNIKSGKYPDTEFVVSGKNVTITNNAEFRSVVINDAKAYTDKAANSIVVNDNNDLAITVSKKTEKLTIAGNGNYVIKGNKNSAVKLEVSDTAKGAIISLKSNIDVRVNANVTINVAKGAENAKITTIGNVDVNVNNNSKKSISVNDSQGIAHVVDSGKTVNTDASLKIDQNGKTVATEKPDTTAKTGETTKTSTTAKTGETTKTSTTAKIGATTKTSTTAKTGATTNTSATTKNSTTTKTSTTTKNSTTTNTSTTTKNNTTTKTSTTTKTDDNKNDSSKSDDNTSDSNDGGSSEESSGGSSSNTPSTPPIPDLRVIGSFDLDGNFVIRDIPSTVNKLMVSIDDATPVEVTPSDNVATIPAASINDGKGGLYKFVISAEGYKPCTVENKMRRVAFTAFRLGNWQELSDGGTLNIEVNTSDIDSYSYGSSIPYCYVGNYKDYTLVDEYSCTVAVKKISDSDFGTASSFNSLGVDAISIIKTGLYEGTGSQVKVTYTVKNGSYSATASVIYTSKANVEPAIVKINGNTGNQEVSVGTRLRAIAYGADGTTPASGAITYEWRLYSADESSSEHITGNDNEIDVTSGYAGKKIKCVVKVNGSEKCTSDAITVTAATP